MSLKKKGGDFNWKSSGVLATSEKAIKSLQKNEGSLIKS